MDYLLDTNVCIALINGRPAAVRTRLTSALETGATVWVPVVALYGLWYGAAKSSQPQESTKRVEEFLAGPVRLLTFQETDAREAGLIRAALEKSGNPIGAYDVLIAGQALGRGLTLVTANEKEFRRVRGLRWEDWYGTHS